MATRHQVRQSVISLLYAKDLNEANPKFIEEFLSEKKIRNEQRNFTLTLYNGVCENLGELDENIAKFLKEIDKVSKLETAILRLSAYELLFTDTPKAIIINEAVELAKELCHENAPKFINGVLDSIKKEAK